MALTRARRLPVLGATFLALACGGGGGGGGTEPPGPPTQLVISGGNGQNWFFNNPLPTQLSVKALDANNRAVPGVVVNWAVASGDGAVAPAQSTTNASGVASTIDSIGSMSPQTVTATPAITTLPTQTFTASAKAPPTSAAVTVGNDFYSPKDVVIKTGGTVTWTWNSAGVIHDVDYDHGPTPLPASSIPQGSGTHSNTITPVGKYTYHCNFHSMNGSVTVVH